MFLNFFEILIANLTESFRIVLAAHILYFLGGKMHLVFIHIYNTLTNKISHMCLTCQSMPHMYICRLDNIFGLMLLHELKTRDQLALLK